MAIFHSTAKVCSTSAKAKIDYISRQKKYSHSSKAEDLVHYEEHNLPKWAKSARDFFSEMDKQELSKEEKEYKNLSPQERRERDLELKENGETLKRKVKCREIEFALPVELKSKKDKIEFAQEYCAEILGDNHVYAFAIHENEGAISGEKNPHVHLVYSDRILEHDREVDREDFCRQRTGYKKDMDIVGKDRSKWVEKNRELLANKINRVLEEKNIKERVTHKSFKDRGLDQKPTFHLGNEVISQLKNGKIKPSEAQKYNRYRDTIEKQIEWSEKKKIEEKTKPLKVTTWNRIKAGVELPLAYIYPYKNESVQAKKVDELKAVITGNHKLRKEIEEKIHHQSDTLKRTYIAKIERNLSSDPRGRYRTYSKAASDEYELRIRRDQQRQKMEAMAKKIEEERNKMAREEEERRMREERERNLRLEELRRRRAAEKEERLKKEAMKEIEEIIYSAPKIKDTTIKQEQQERINVLRSNLSHDEYRSAYLKGKSRYEKDNPNEANKTQEKTVQRNTGMSR